MSMLDRRLQVLIDQERWSRLELEAEQRHITVSRLVREAIDERYPSRSQERRLALQMALDANPMDVPETESLRVELDALRGRRPA